MHVHWSTSAWTCLSALNCSRHASSTSLLFLQRHISLLRPCVRPYGLCTWLRSDSIAGRSHRHIWSAQSKRGLFSYPNPVRTFCGNMRQRLFLTCIPLIVSGGRSGIISGDGHQIMGCLSPRATCRGFNWLWSRWPTSGLWPPPRGRFPCFDGRFLRLSLPPAALTHGRRDTWWPAGINTGMCISLPPSCAGGVWR